MLFLWHYKENILSDSTGVTRAMDDKMAAILLFLGEKERQIETEWVETQASLPRPFLEWKFTEVPCLQCVQRSASWLPLTVQAKLWFLIISESAEKRVFLGFPITCHGLLLGEQEKYEGKQTETGLLCARALSLPNQPAGRRGNFLSVPGLKLTSAQGSWAIFIVEWGPGRLFLEGQPLWTFVCWLKIL